MNVINAFLYKYGIMLSSMLMAFFMPISWLLLIIIITCGVDMITAYARDSKRYKKLQTITSSKLRKTSIKTTSYIVVLLLIYAIAYHSISPEVSLYLTKFAFFAFASNELFSIGENLSIVNADNIFLKTIRNIVRKSTSYLNSLMEDKEKNKEEII